MVAAGGLLVLAALRAALPGWVKEFVNRTLDQGAEYTGDVGDIEVHLWRGAYAINDVRITKRRHAVAVPFFRCPRIEFSVDWRSLRHGTVRGTVRMESPELNFVAGATSADTQTGGQEPWLSIIKDLYPFELDRAEVVDGRVHFHAFHTRPKVDVALSEVNATLDNLSNIQQRSDAKPATLHAEAAAMESGHVQLDMTLDPDAHRPTFDMAARLLDLDVTRLNTLALAYGDFDFSQGRFDLVVEATAQDGQLEGYAKPLFRGLRVVDLRDFRDDDPLQLLWEALVGVAGAVFRNQSRDQFGTRFSFAGTVDEPRTSVLQVVGNVLYNAFVRAYLPQVEGRSLPAWAVTVDPDTYSVQEDKRHEP